MAVCRECKEIISQYKSKRSKFCSIVCKNKYWNKKTQRKKGFYFGENDGKICENAHNGSSKEKKTDIENIQSEKIMAEKGVNGV